MIFILLCSFTFALGKNIPDGITICHKSDPEFGDCFAKSMETSLKLLTGGNKDMGLPPLEPLFVKEMDIGGTSGKTVSLHQKYHNVRVHGLTDSKFRMLDVNLTKGCSWKMDVFTPLVRIEGDYSLKGQILVFPLDSKGKCNITQYNLHDIHTITCERYTKDGQTYLKIINFKLDMKLERIHFEFTDVFPGNQQISENILKTVNENGLVIFNEVKTGFESVFGFIESQNYNNVLAKFTEEQLFPQ